MATGLQQRILLRAAELLEHDGWCQGYLRDDFGRMCASGAIGAAIEEMCPVDGDPDTWEDVACRVARHVGARMLTAWNDESERTKDEVIAALRQVAVTHGE